MNVHKNWTIIIYNMNDILIQQFAQQYIWKVKQVDSTRSILPLKYFPDYYCHLDWHCRFLSELSSSIFLSILCHRWCSNKMTKNKNAILYINYKFREKYFRDNVNTLKSIILPLRMSPGTLWYRSYRKQNSP